MDNNNLIKFPKSKPSVPVNKIYLAGGMLALLLALAFATAGQFYIALGLAVLAALMCT